MPLYEYQCVECRERVEVIQKHSDPPYSNCPKCNGEMKKLVSAPAIQFKGSGFYKTDYASSSSSPASSSGGSSTDSKSDSKSDGKSNAASDSKSESKSSESKTETKSESKPDNSSKSE